MCVCICIYVYVCMHVCICVYVYIYDLLFVVITFLCLSKLFNSIHVSFYLSKKLF